ncbi:hypothetical protein [Litoreibacter janthinus]|uniref:Uncharacterized protein n=1 Tax=Litoreibacter janthinus TaxID=670154 RepID=A0A1I6GQH3_9RHOB|nr:hypothetical protein [Litoreibacter janthinus]SFR44341.1 hypothetical protein SAMN04488002_1831 [Litoreibacter janthinus]
MSCRGATTSPDQNSGDNTPNDEPCATCGHNCPSVEIEINNTSTTDDDLVVVKCERPTRRSRVQCRIKSTSAGSNHTIVLTNPDGRLRFAGAADTTRILTVPDDGNWVAFEISGETGSAAMNDAVIEAHCLAADGPVVGSKTVTVVHFDQPKMDIASPGNYVVGTEVRSGTAVTTLSVASGRAVTYEMSARIRPSGVDCSAPQISDLRVGLLQNLMSTTRTKGWDSPTVTWNSGVPAGTTANIPSRIVSTLSVSTQINDSETNASPVYDRPGIASMLDPNSLRKPIGCTGGGTATTFDTPSRSATTNFVLDVTSGAGAVLGRANYTLSLITMNDSFISWSVIFNTTTNDVCTLRERPWSLNVSTAATGTQRATVGAATAPATTAVTTAPFINDAARDPANTTTTGNGSITVTK